MGAAIPGRCAPAEAPNTARPPAMQGDGGNEVSQSGIGLSLPPASDGGRVVILPSTSAKGGTAPAEIGFEQRGQRRSGGRALGSRWCARWHPGRVSSRAPARATRQPRSPHSPTRLAALRSRRPIPLPRGSSPAGAASALAVEIIDGTCGAPEK
jgi:hypothetical protein